MTLATPYTRIKYTRASLLKIRDTCTFAVPANFEEITILLRTEEQKRADKSGRRQVKKTETDGTGFQSVRRVSKRDEALSPIAAPVEDGLDDIQRFRLQMKAQEPQSSPGSQQAPTSLPIQSANIFDILDQLETAQFEAPATGKSKFDRLFTEDEEKKDDDREYAKVVDMLAKSLKVNSQEVEEENPLAALLNSSIKSKKKSVV